MKKNKDVSQSDKDSVVTFKELTKLIITLSTGVFVLSPAFLGFIKLQEVERLWIMYLSWVGLGISIGTGLLVMSSLAGTQHKNEYDIDNKLTQTCSIIQWLSFFIGIVLFGIFVAVNL